MIKNLCAPLESFFFRLGANFGAQRREGEIVRGTGEGKGGGIRTGLSRGAREIEEDVLAIFTRMNSIRPVISQPRSILSLYLGEQNKVAQLDY